MFAFQHTIVLWMASIPFQVPCEITLRLPTNMYSLLSILLHHGGTIHFAFKSDTNAAYWSLSTNHNGLFYHRLDALTETVTSLEFWMMYGMTESRRIAHAHNSAIISVDVLANVRGHKAGKLARFKRLAQSIV